MARRVLSSVGTSPVAVTAGANGWQVSVSCVPGAPSPFNAYDASQNLLTSSPVPNNSTYQFNAPQTGDPYYPGQVVGFISVPSGTASFIIDDSNPTLYGTVLNGGVYPTAGAVTIKRGTGILTGATAQAYTLAVPIAGADDFKELRLVNQSGQAHTVTTPTNGINGASHIATFAATVGATLFLFAYQGVWYVPVSTGNGITLS